MRKQMHVLKSGRTIRMVRGWNRRDYHPGLFSLTKCIRLLLRYQDAKKHKKFYVSSTTGGWETFGVRTTVAPLCKPGCQWHKGHTEPYPESDATYVAE